VSENSEKNNAVLLRFVGEASSHLSDSLIDRLIKSHRLREDHVLMGRLGSYPQEQNTRSQCAIFCDRLLKLKTRVQSHACMERCYLIERPTSGLPALTL